jgi:hypothetical protein
MPDHDEVVRLLAALKRAGCRVFIEDETLFVSPPLRHLDWPEDGEAAIERHYWELKDLILAERLTVH